MGWCTTSDLDQFTAVAGGYLGSRAAENTLLLSGVQEAYAARLNRPPAASPGRAAVAGPLYGWWEPPEGGPPRGAFLHDPPVPLLLSCRLPEIAAALAAALARLSRQVCGVDATAGAADAFAAAWTQRAGTMARVHRHCNVYRLTAADLARPGSGPPAGTVHGPAGRLRVAGPGDLPLVTRWLAAYAAETAERIGSPADLAADLISYRGAVLWELPPRPGHRWDGHHRVLPYRREAAAPAEGAAQPAALAALTRPVAGSVRVSMVYTPGEHRRRGYAAAVTLAVSRAVLAGDASSLLGGPAARGPVAEVVLITDRNRPDRWGTRLGYQLVSERTVLRFGPMTGPLPRLPGAGRAPRLPTGPLPRLPRLPR